MAGIENATGVQYRNGDFFDHILTDFYEPTIVDTLNSVTLWCDRIERSDRHIVGGKFIRWPARVGRNWGVHFLAHNGFLPDPQSQQWTTHSNRVLNYYGRILMDGVTWDNATVSAASYLDAVDPEMRYVVEDAKVDIQRALMNDGSGRLGVVSGAPAANQVTMAAHSGIQENGTMHADLTRVLEPNMGLMFVQDDGTSAEVGFVVSVDSDTTFTVSQTPGGAADDGTIADTDWIVRASRDGSTSTADSAYRNEVLGLEGVFSDTGILDGNGINNNPDDRFVLGSVSEYQANSITDEANAGFQGLAITGNSWNEGILLTAGADRDPTDALFQTAISEAERVNNANVSMVLTTYGVYNKYLEDLTPDKRYVNTQELVGGGRVFEFNGIPLFKEKDMNGNRAYFIAEDQFVFQETKGLSWLDRDGSIWHRVTDKDSWEAAFCKRFQLMVHCRNRAGVSLLRLNEA